MCKCTIKVIMKRFFKTCVKYLQKKSNLLVCQPESDSFHVTKLVNYTNNYLKSFLFNFSLI